jgi:hypothetical protein
MGMGLALSAALGLGTLAFSSALAETPAGSITTNTGGILLQNGGFNGSNFNATVAGRGIDGPTGGGGSYLTNTNVNQSTNNSGAAVGFSGNSLNANVNTNCAGVCIKGAFPSGGPVW